ncbi:hypothetical protein GCM10018789_03500 [Streptomyces werraensis]|nr:hypothetical protein GCM10018789_03500 [Streptomyces werraensis]
MSRFPSAGSDGARGRVARAAAPPVQQDDTRVHSAEPRPRTENHSRSPVWRPGGLRTATLPVEQAHGSLTPTNSPREYASCRMR